MAYTDNIISQIADLLEDDGIGTPGVNIFEAKEPDSPDNCITVYKTGGLQDHCLDATSRSSEVHNFQIRVRNNSYPSAHSEMEGIKASIEKQHRTIVDGGGTNTFQITATGLPVDLQRDSTNRCIVVCNFSCIRNYS